MAHFLVWCCHLWKRVSTTRAYLRRNKSMQTKLKYITPGRLLYKMTAPLNTSADRLDVRLRYLSAFPRTSAPNYGLLDVTGNVHRTWAAFIYGYPLLPYFLPTKTAQRHAVLSWYTYSGARPSCNWCSVFTVMRIPIIARHNETR